jgi:Protein of unknown function (DUF3467)
MAREASSSTVQEQEVRVRVSDDVHRGSYANLALVSHSAHEFTIDFCQVQSSEGPGVEADVVARVRVAPTLVGAIISALRSNVEDHEAAFGPIKDVQ